MPEYMFSEYGDMLLTLNECHGFVRAAVRHYADKYPNRNLPKYKTFLFRY